MLVNGVEYLKLGFVVRLKRNTEAISLASYPWVVYSCDLNVFVCVVNDRDSGFSFRFHSLYPEPCFLYLQPKNSQVC